MKISWTGKIAEDFYALGHASVPVYLLDGPFPALFDAGFTGLAEKYIEAIRGVLKKRTPEFLFLTHAHWDHVGAAGIFKKIWPGLKIVASEEAAHFLTKPKVTRTIATLNREALSALQKWGITPLHERAFEPFSVDRCMPREKSVGLSDRLSVEGIFTPGHTRDFVAYWIPERRVLIASEAAGCDNVPEFLVNYDAYIAGLNFFMRLETQVLCVGHQLVVTGKDVAPYLREARNIAEKYRANVETLLKKGEDVDSIAAHLKKREWDIKSFPKQPEQTYLINTKVRIKTLKKGVKHLVFSSENA